MFLNLSRIGEDWPQIFSRQKAEELTGGGIDARTLANLDCLGEGPAGRFKIGRKVMYSRELFIEWLKKRINESSVAG